MTSFEKWFSSDWGKMLHAADDEGEALSCGRIRDASWDRRAGYLMWRQLGSPEADWVAQTKHLYAKPGVASQDDEDLLAGPVESPVPAPLYDDEDLLS